MVPKEKLAKLDPEASGTVSKSSVDNPSAACPFCSIVRKEVRAYEVFRDEISVAFLDRRPVFLGHCLLIPNDHYETLLNLPQSLIGPFFTRAQLLARAVQAAMNADGSLVLINNKVSQSVPHLHIHIIPRKVGDHLRGFMWPRLKYESEALMTEIMKSIREAVSRN